MTADPSGPIIFISTQTASNSASLQFTNLPTGFNTLFLNGNIIPGTNNTVQVQIGEGTTPTWMTTGYYGDLTSVNTGGTTSTSGSVNASALPLTTGTDNSASYENESFKLLLDSISTTSGARRR